MGAFTSPLLFERYELKFHIPLSMVDEISKYVEIFCQLDPYSDREPDKFYKVNNIYLDTPNFLFLERRLSGMDHRFNLRLRAYGDNPVFPYFCEAKHKTCGIVKKKRAKIFEDNWQSIFLAKDFSLGEGAILEDSKDYKAHFLRLAYVNNAQPKVFTQYRRKAYASIVDDYARVTFDRDLRFERRERYDLTPMEENLSHYDNPNNFQEDTNVILELKCTTKVPKWFMDMITMFNLERTSFSKYVTGVTEVMDEFKYRNPHQFDRVAQRY